MRGLYGAALGGSYLVQAAVQGATHHTPRPPRITTGAAPQLPPRRRYLTVYSTVKGTLRTQKALRRSEEMDLFFLGLTTAQMAVSRTLLVVVPRVSAPMMMNKQADNLLDELLTIM